jgi:hypothetical protein
MANRTLPPPVAFLSVGMGILVVGLSLINRQNDWVTGITIGVALGVLILSVKLIRDRAPAE